MAMKPFSWKTVVLVSSSATENRKKVEEYVNGEDDFEDHDDDERTIAKLGLNCWFSQSATDAKHEKY